MVANAAQNIGEGRDVLASKGLEQQFVEHCNMAGENLRQGSPALLGNRHHRGALIVERRRADDQPALFERLGLIGETAAAVDHAVCKVGHATVSFRRIAQSSQELELHIAETTDVPQLLFDRMPQETAHLDERKIGGQLGGIE